MASAGDRARSAGIELDRAAVTHKIAESRAAATLLTAIFDAEEDGERAAPADASGADPVLGLDPAHSALLHALATRPSWTREELASLAAAHGVLPDGAVDVLNEVAIERAGAPVISDGDTLAVDDDVVQELLS